MEVISFQANEDLLATEEGEESADDSAYCNSHPRLLC